jgi:hypothetical protein
MRSIKEAILIVFLARLEGDDFLDLSEDQIMHIGDVLWDVMRDEKIENDDPTLPYILIGFINP